MPSFWETLQVNGQEMPTYVSVPSGSGPFPAVVLAQVQHRLNKLKIVLLRGLSVDKMENLDATLLPDHHLPILY